MRTNLLKSTRCYLCGPMEMAADSGINWRRMITSILKPLGIIWLDPTNKPINKCKEDPDFIARLRQMRLAGQYQEVADIVREIRCCDLRMVDISDFLIVHIDTNIHSAGTWEEITTANRQKKPIIVHCEQGKAQAPGWLFGMIPHEHIFGNWNGLVSYLIRINTTEETDTTGRWLFFDWTGEDNEQTTV